MEEKKIDNLEFWNKYKSVPSNAVKAFDNGSFKGTDINTMWRLKCLTETFGMCGFGWYYKLIRTWVEDTKNAEQFAFAEIELYIKQDGEWSMPIVGTGGNKLTRVKRDGSYMTSDEAFKMAITDAIGVACRNLGIGADVYWENDKTKYTEGDRINKQEKSQPTQPKPQTATKGEILGIQADAGSIEDWQKLKMQELGVDISGAVEFMAVPELDLLSKAQAQFIIDKKQNALNKRG